MEILENLSPNFSTGRRGRVPEAIVLHITAGLMGGCLNWLCNSAAQASAHYLVTKLGEVYQLVADENTAWHAGAVANPTWDLYDGTNPNRYTIGIEFECVSGGELTEEQYQAGLWLIRQLVEKCGIPIDWNHIIGHCRIDGMNRPNDPGPDFPWSRLFADLLYPPLNVRVGDIVLAGISVNGSSFTPVRAFGEALGHVVEWDGDTNTAKILPVTADVVKTEYVKVAVASKILIPLVLNNHTYVPVRAITDVLGLGVTWDADSNTAVVE